jgi:TatD DNase family protein
MLIDAHNHLQDPRFDGDQESIISAMKSVGIDCCIVNGTESADWIHVVELAQRYPEFVLPSFGLHPWKTKGRAEGWLETLSEFLQRFPKAGVGEIGLDRWIEDHDIDDQLIVFREQMDLAVELDRPCTIHCLRAWGQLLKELKSRESLPRFLVHSFGGSIETGRKLAELGAYFSFSGYFLHTRKEKVVDVFRQLPSDRILLETDAPDMLPPDLHRPFGDDARNHPANLANIYERFFELTSVTAEQLYENTDRWWSGNNA